VNQANQMLAHLGEQQTAGFMLVLARISPLFVIAPLFSSKLITMRARAVVAVAIAIGLSPLALKGHKIPLETFALGGLIVKEIMVGLAFSFAIAALFAAVSVAGSFLDTIVGFSYGSLIDPVTGTQSPVLAQTYSMVGVMVFIAIGGDAWMVRGLAETYSLVPLLSMPDLATLTAGAQHAFSGVFLAALELAAPVMLALIITDAGFGVVSRVVPQLNVFAVGFPAKILVGIALIGASLPFAAGWIGDELQQSVRAALQSLRVA
jgi:flagellar biosynthetic protein FliR